MKKIELSDYQPIGCGVKDPSPKENLKNLVFDGKINQVGLYQNKVIKKINELIDDRNAHQSEHEEDRGMMDFIERHNVYFTPVSKDIQPKEECKQDYSKQAEKITEWLSENAQFVCFKGAIDIRDFAEFLKTLN